MTGVTYTPSTWDRYAEAHASVMTSFQWEMFREAASWLRGDVLDGGCGTARVAPLLADRKEVRSYTGVDLAAEMVVRAQRLITALGREEFVIRHGTIEKVTGEYDSAVSIHSFYSWSDPKAVLVRIHQVLRPGGLLVLVTPNEQLHMERLLTESAKELLGHPHFEEFRRMNLALAAAPEARFVTMDTLVQYVRDAGFRVTECHQRLYLGGANFLVATRGG